MRNAGEVDHWNARAAQADDAVHDLGRLRHGRDGLEVNDLEHAGDVEAAALVSKFADHDLVLDCWIIPARRHWRG
jgi:hypothetical protein